MDYSFMAQLAVIRPVLEEILVREEGISLWEKVFCDQDDLIRDEERYRPRFAFESDGQMRATGLPVLVMLVRLLQASDILARWKAGEFDHMLDTVDAIVGYVGVTNELPHRLYYEDEHLPGYRFVSISGRLVVVRLAKSPKPTSSSQTRLRAVHLES